MSTPIENAAKKGSGELAAGEVRPARKEPTFHCTAAPIPSIMGVVAKTMITASCATTRTTASVPNSGPRRKTAYPMEATTVKSTAIDGGTLGPGMGGHRLVWAPAGGWGKPYACAAGAARYARGSG